MRGQMACRTVAACVAVGILACGTANAQYASDFEPPTFTGSPEGTIMTGQDGWYIPPATESTDYLVYTYEGNALGIPDNPAGGGVQFVAGTGPAGGTYARAQRDHDWTAETLWTCTYEVCCTYDGDPNGTANNLGSFSLQPSTTGIGSWNNLFSWTDPGSGYVGWQAFYLHHDAAGNQVAQPGSSPGPEWGDLELNHWYRLSTTFDYEINQITEVSITDLVTGGSATYEPTEWYLSGGADAGPPTVTAFRFFAGGGVPGNTVAWDNLSIGPPGEACPADIDGDGDTDLNDLAALLTAYGSSVGDPNYNPNADFEPDGDVDLTDLAFVLSDYGCVP